MTSPETTLDSFIGKFDTDNQALIRALRAALRHRLPGCNELVYDNYNFFVIGYCPSERPSDCIVSIAASANGAVLSFYRGNALRDTNGLLQGDGKQNRFVRLPSADVLSDNGVDALIEQACRLSTVPHPWTGGKLIIRSISAKQRLRRKA